MFFRLREGAVGCQHLSTGRAHDGGGVGFSQPAGEDQGVNRLHLLFENLDLLPGLLHLLVAHRFADLAVNAVDGQQVLRHGGPPP